MARGKYASLGEASRRNGIKGSETLVRQIQKYGREGILPKRIKAETVKEIGELEAARNGNLSHYGKKGDFAAWAMDASVEVSAAWEFKNFGRFRRKPCIVSRCCQMVELTVALLPDFM